MKQTFALVALLSIIWFSSCEKDEVRIDSARPNGALTVAKRGTFVAQNGTPTAGSVELGTDSDGVEFLRFASNFTTELATGTVTVYLSTSDTFSADPGNGNPSLRLVGIVSQNGEVFFKLDPAAESKFTHVILWCGTAAIPFGNAALQ